MAAVVPYRARSPWRNLAVRAGWACVVALLAPSWASGQVVEEIKGADFEDWVAAAATDRSAVYALTIGENESFFGKACRFSDDACEYRLGVRRHCSDGSRHAALVTSDAGNVMVPMVCLGSGPRSGRAVFVFEDYAAVDRIVRKATRLTVSLALGSGRAQLLEFSLRGSTGATRWVDEARARKQGPAGEKPPAPRNASQREPVVAAV